MKKFLSLVLALVMTMSLVTVSAGAKDFTDSTKIQYTEAVDVMSAVKVIDGYTDGSFNPSATLTRGAAAKIICNLILGPTTASALVADAAPYKDVPTTNVFAGYIAYCQKEGIISGYADGTFKPANSLTGYAFMKMLLGALGYDAEVEGYTGANWSINVAKRAINIGLDDGLTGSFNGVKAVNREEACLYAFNTLQATMVEYDSKTNISVGGAQVVIAGSKAREVEQGTYDSYKGQPVAKDNTLQFCEKYFKDLKLDEGHDDFGRPANTWKVKKVEVGTYTNRSDLMGAYTKKVTQGDLYTLIGKDACDDLKSGESTLTVNLNGEPKKVAVDTFFQKNSSDASGSGAPAGLKSAKGRVTEVYMDDDNNVDVVVYDTWVFQAAEDYNSKKETIKIVAAGDTDIKLNSNTLELDDFDAIKDLKEDDYILVTATVDGAKYEVQSIEKAETVTGTVNSYKDCDSVTLGGTSYDYSATTSDAANGVQATKYTVGQNAVVVLDKYGYVIAVDEALVSSNYVFIGTIATKVNGLVAGTASADAYYTDGTHEEVVVDKIINGNTTLDTAGKIAVAGNMNKWYTYSKSSDGKIILLNVESKYNVANAKYAGNGSTDVVIMENDKVAFLTDNDTAPNNIKNAKANDATIVVTRETDGASSVYTGVKSVPDVKLTKTATSSDKVNVYTLVNKNTGYTAYTFVDTYNLDDTDVSIVGGDENSAFVYVVKYDGQYYYNNNDTYYTYKVLNTETGAEEAVKFDSNFVGTGDIFGLYYKARTNSDSEITSMPSVPNSGKYFNTTFSGTVTFEDGVLSLGSTPYTLASDAEIVLVTLKASGLNKDPDAKYEVSTALSGKGLANALKGYTVTNAKIAGATTEAGNSKIQTLYVTVGSTAAVVAKSDDASIKSIKVKGVEATLKNGKYEVTLPASVAADTTTTKVATKTTDVAATVTYTVNNTDWTANANGTAAFGSNATITIKVVAEDKTTSKTYTLNVTIAAASSGAMISNSNAVVVDDSGMKVKIDSTFNGDITVADLYSALGFNDDCGDFDTITIKSAFGTTLDTTSTYQVKAGMQVIFHADGNADKTYTVEFV